MSDDLHPVTKLRAWRKHRGLTLRELAEPLGCTFVTISRWERGERGLTVQTLQRLAEVLQCTIYDLLFTIPKK